MDVYANIDCQYQILFQKKKCLQFLTFLCKDNILTEYIKYRKHQSTNYGNHEDHQHHKDTTVLYY